MAFTPFHLQIAGLVIFAGIALAAGWWVLRTAMGWHRGSTFAWFHAASSDDDGQDEDDDPDDGDTADTP